MEPLSGAFACIANGDAAQLDAIISAAGQSTIDLDVAQQLAVHPQPQSHRRDANEARAADDGQAGHLGAWRAHASRSEWQLIRQSRQAHACLFPTDDSADANAVYRDDVDALLGSTEWQQQYCEAVHLVAASWGWDAAACDWLPAGAERAAETTSDAGSGGGSSSGGNSGGGRHALETLARSLWVFRQRRLLESVQALARALRSLLDPPSAMPGSATLEPEVSVEAAASPQPRVPPSMPAAVPTAALLCYAVAPAVAELQHEKHSLLGYACAHGAATALLQAVMAAQGVDLNHGKLTATPLHLAASRGHAHAVCCLLRAPGVDVNRARRDGTTPLMMAVQRGRCCKPVFPLLK
jgi:hypothetical protein